MSACDPSRNQWRFSGFCTCRHYTEQHGFGGCGMRGRIDATTGKILTRGCKCQAGWVLWPNPGSGKVLVT